MIIDNFSTKKYYKVEGKNFIEKGEIIMIMQVGQFPKIHLGKTDPVLHTLEKKEIEELSGHTADLMLNESMMVLVRSESEQKAELDNEIKIFKNLFHPMGKLSKVRNMSNEEVIKLAQKIREGVYAIAKIEGKKVTLKKWHVKELLDAETGAHTHEAITVTTKVYFDKEEKGVDQIKLLIDDIDGIEI